MVVACCDEQCKSCTAQCETRKHKDELVVQRDPSGAEDVQGDRNPDEGNVDQVLLPLLRLVVGMPYGGDVENHRRDEVGHRSRPQPPSNGTNPSIPVAMSA